MAALSGALGLGGLDIVMQGQCSGRRLGMDGFVSLQAHVWKEAQYIEANMIEMEVNANGIYLNYLSFS